MKHFFIVGTAFCLSSCILPMTRQETLDVYRRSCLDYGFQWGTPEFAQCVQDQEYQEQKLSIENRKAQALEDQTRVQRLNSYNTWGASPFYSPSKKHKSHNSSSSIHQKVKQKVRSQTNNTTHIQSTHIQHTYNPSPQPLIIQQSTTQVPSTPLPPASQPIQPILSSPDSGPSQDSPATSGGYENPVPMDKAPPYADPQVKETSTIAIVPPKEETPPPAMVLPEPIVPPAFPAEQPELNQAPAIITTVPEPVTPPAVSMEKPKKPDEEALNPSSLPPEVSQPGNLPEPFQQDLNAKGNLL